MEFNEQHQIKLLAETNFLRFVERDGWSYVERKSSHQVVCIAAYTQENKVLLIEQFRPPVNANVIEMPAGLCGDLTDDPQEELETAARRELLEETGYDAEQFQFVACVASSAGLTSEVINLFVATGLTKIEAGGGDSSEEITIHEVPATDVDGWLAQAAGQGKLIDARVYGGLYLLQQIHE